MPRLLDALDTSAWRRPHVLVALGKGGVGKTTVSLRLGYELAEEGYEVLVASMDPAAHMLEYLGLGSPMKEEVVAPRLRAVQYTVDKVAERLAAEYASLLQRLMPGLTALGGFDFARVVRESPGFEEEVFLRILSSLYGRSDVDAVVVDTPPTGIALRVLRLPRLYTAWVRILSEVRERIVATRYAIANALGRPPPRGDPVLEKLEELRRRYGGLLEELRSPERTGLVVVAAPEPLPLYEARQVAATARELGFRLELVVANRVLSVEDEVLEELRRLRCSVAPPAGFAAIAQAERPTSSLDDVKALGRYIVEAVRGPC